MAAIARSKRSGFARVSRTPNGQVLHELGTMSLEP
jgi:hypothetical protein